MTNWILFCPHWTLNCFWRVYWKQLLYLTKIKVSSTKILTFSYLTNGIILSILLLYVHIFFIRNKSNNFIFGYKFFKSVNLKYIDCLYDHIQKWTQRSERQKGNKDTRYTKLSLYMSPEKGQTTSVSCLFYAT